MNPIIIAQRIETLENIILSRTAKLSKLKSENTNQDAINEARAELWLSMNLAVKLQNQNNQKDIA